MMSRTIRRMAMAALLTLVIVLLANLLSEYAYSTGVFSISTDVLASLFLFPSLSSLLWLYKGGIEQKVKA